VTACCESIEDESVKTRGTIAKAVGCVNKAIALNFLAQERNPEALNQIKLQIENA
jgi:hypothetical protein